MVRKNSLARDFITSATLGFSGVWANTEETGSVAVAPASMATARRRPANGSFMDSLRSYDYCEQRRGGIWRCRKRLRSLTMRTLPDFVNLPRSQATRTIKRQVGQAVVLTILPESVKAFARLAATCINAADVSATCAWSDITAVALASSD
ncbi:hypothetical protein D3C76_842120 [compost metagenome]